VGFFVFENVFENGTGEILGGGHSHFSEATRLAKIKIY